MAFRFPQHPGYPEQPNIPTQQPRQGFMPNPLGSPAPSQFRNPAPRRRAHPPLQHGQSARAPVPHPASPELGDDVADAPKGCMADNYEEKVRPLIDLVDKFRRFGLDQDVGLPSIVVVGDQSAGKSSVLEAISGVQLPRGTGIVTRCPLELRLKRNKNVTWEGRIKYGSHEEDIFNHDEVKQEVDKAQKILAGADKGISSELITLEIESPSLPDLTLVDLPGITRVAVKGQDKYVGDTIKAMIEGYIEKSETIILAVTPANVDIATSEALQMAENVDLKGERTIGVITKTDLVDAGSESELTKILSNDRYHLKKGFFAVKCRGQKAIDSNQSLAKATEAEDIFFETSRFFREFAKCGLCGIRALSTKLALELATHIKLVLPSLKKTITSELHSTEGKLVEMGNGIPTDDAAKRQFLNKCLRGYTDVLKKLADGHENDVNTELRLHNMARKEYEIFATAIQKEVPQKRGKNTNKIYNEFVVQIQRAIDDDTGRELPGFMKFDTFKRLAWQIVEKFKAPSDQCLDTVIHQTQDRLCLLASEKFSKYPVLESKVKDIISTVTHDGRTQAAAALKEMFEMESLVFSQAQTYTRSYASVSVDKGESVHDPRRIDGFGQPDQHMRIQAESMFTRIQAYLEICVLRIADVVPMIIMQHAIIRVVWSVSEKVDDLIHRKSGALEALEEPPDEKHKRERLEAKLKRLEKAKDEMDGV